jgi:hypothetical protein
MSKGTIVRATFFRLKIISETSIKHDHPDSKKSGRLCGKALCQKGSAILLPTGTPVNAIRAKLGRKTHKSLHRMMLAGYSEVVEKFLRRARTGAIWGGSVVALYKKYFKL